MCSKQMKVITWKHLQSHEMTISAYKLKYPAYPTSSPTAILTKKQSAIKANAHRIGVPRTADIKRKISNTKKTKNYVAWNKGIPKSSEDKKRQSIRMLEKYKTGQICHWNWNNTTPDVTKNKISKTLLSQHNHRSQSSKDKHAATISHKRDSGWVHPSTEKFINKLSTTSLDKLADRDWLYCQHITNERTISSICVELGLHWNNSHKTVKSKIIEFDIPIKHWHQTSSCQQRDVETFLQNNKIMFQTNNRNIISPLELDIYIPKHNIAIEYCGLYWHSNAHKTNRYHLEKYKMCANLGIRLITIFEDEWLHKQQIVQSKLLHILGKSATYNIHARKTSIIQLDVTSRNTFLEKHHIQGEGSGSVTYGLQYNDKLVAVIAFNNHNSTNWTLNRFATSDNVRGGFAKLLTHFKRNHTWNTIKTFADLRWDTGDVYKHNGFDMVQTLRPDYQYIIKNKREHKFNFRHDRLKHRIDHYDPTKSEIENTENNGVLRIYDCGKLKYVCHNPTSSTTQPI